MARRGALALGPALMLRLRPLETLVWAMPRTAIQFQKVDSRPFWVLVSSVEGDTRSSRPPHAPRRIWWRLVQSAPLRFSWR